MLEKILELLEPLNQPHLLYGVDGLSSQELDLFFRQLQKYPLTLLQSQRELVAFRGKKKRAVPCISYEKSGNREDSSKGLAMISEGKVGCLILAGGQGTRLGFDGPKGIVPVTPFTKKSLFQLFCERTKMSCALGGKELPLCIMTSPVNHARTLSFFYAHQFFGLQSSQVEFFQQKLLPFIDDRGNWLLERAGKIAEGPDGNGQALHLFFKNGIWKKWKERGIEYLNVIFVDNALADPFDPDALGFAQRTKSDAVLKAIERLSANECMGAVGQRSGNIHVVEYSEVDANASEFLLSSTGMFCISMEYIRYLCEEVQTQFPLHLAEKKAKTLDPECKEGIVREMQLWKSERFIFDLLHFVRSSAVLVYPREKIYAPLKNAVGDKSLKTVQQALVQNQVF